MSDYAGVTRIVGTSGTNAINNTSTVVGKAYRLRMVTVSYSLSTTQSVTVTLISGAGAAYNVVLNTISISATTTGVYIPVTPIPINADDIITVSAPALVAQTSSIAIYADRLAG